MPESEGKIRRRHVLTGLWALGVSVARSGHAQTDGQANAAAQPQVDDTLVYAFGEREGEPIRPGDLEAGAQQVSAWPMDPVSNTIRNGTRLNQIIVIRLNPDWLSAETLARSVDGVVAYSGICSHTGCDVTEWDAAVSRFQCPCHESQFDPSDSARVVGGPAPWQLAALPLKLLDGQLAVAGEFEGRVGFQQPGLDPFGL